MKSFQKSREVLIFLASSRSQSQTHVVSSTQRIVWKTKWLTVKNVTFIHWWMKSIVEVTFSLTKIVHALIRFLFYDHIIVVKVIIKIAVLTRIQKIYLWVSLQMLSFLFFIESIYTPIGYFSINSFLNLNYVPMAAILGR